MEPKLDMVCSRWLRKQVVASEILETFNGNIGRDAMGWAEIHRKGLWFDQVKDVCRGIAKTGNGNGIC